MALNIGIVLGTTREGRFSEKAAAWIYGIARARSDLEFEAIDLRDYPLPFFDEGIPPTISPPKNAVAQRWAAKLAQLDGFILVAAEYNHGPSAVLKNALDSAYAEFARKPVTFVGYGSVGGARAIEQLRLTAVELQMVPLRNAVHIGVMEYLAIWQQEKTFDDFPHLAKAATGLLDELAWWTQVLSAARAKGN